MNRFLSSPLGLMLALAVGVCVAATPARAPLMNGPDYLITQNRGNAVMPRAQAAMGTPRFEGRALSDRERRTRC